MWNSKSQNIWLICFILLRGLIMIGVPMGIYFLCVYFIGIGEILSGILGFLGLAVTSWTIKKFSRKKLEVTS